MGKQKNFDEAITELEDVVCKLESGELTLEESLDFFQKGMELSKLCSKKLDEAERKIAILIQNENGQFEEKPFKTE